MLAFFSVGIPLLVLIPISLGVARKGWDLHHGLIGMLPLLEPISASYDVK